MAPGTKVHLACRPVSMRYGFDGLCAKVAAVLALDPFSGHLFGFRSKRGDDLKILYGDGSGWVPVRQAAGAGPVRLAADRGRRFDPDAGPVGAVARGDRLAADGGHLGADLVDDEGGRPDSPPPRPASRRCR